MAVRVDPFYVFHGVFEDEAHNERPLLRPYENRRLLTLLLCLCRRWDLFTVKHVQTIMYCVVPNIPFYGLDPHAVFESIMDDVMYIQTQVLFFRVPILWNIVCKNPETASHVLWQVKTMFQNIYEQGEFNTDENDTDYEAHPQPVSLYCGYNEDIVIQISVCE